MYTQFVQTNMVFPVYMDTHKCEFKLPNEVIELSRLRLFNIGATVNVGNASYTTGGALNLIRNIQLYNDSQLISQVRYSDIWNYIQNLKNRNTTNISRNQLLYGDNMGWIYNQWPTEVNVFANIVAQHQNRLSPWGANAHQLTTDPKTTSLANVFLSHYFDFLNQAGTLDCTKLNLRLVIEWTTQPFAELLFNPAGGPASFTIIKPYLLCEVLSDPKEVKPEDVPLLWKEIVCTVVNVPVYPGYNPGAGSPVANLVQAQQVSVMLDSFRNQTIGKIYIVNTPSGTTVDGTPVANTLTGTNTCSYQMWGETLQLLVDGKKTFTGQNGLDLPARKTATLTDVLGTCNVFYGGNLPLSAGTWVTGGNVIGALDANAQNALYSGFAQNQTNYHSIGCFELNKFCERLQLDVSRGIGVYETDGAVPPMVNAASSQLNPYSILLFAEVYKSCKILKSGVIV